jgi:peptidoglycan/xylan/chitin deacetylase (PgdA/CDA1 family)
MNRKDAVRWLGSIFKFIPIKLLYRWANKPLLLPFYHTVSDANLHYINHRYRIKNVVEFKKDLDWIVQNFNQVYDITEFSSAQNSLLLSFDDGFKECYSVIAPILKSYQLNAIFFVNTAFLNDKQYPDFILQHHSDRVYLNDSEVKQLKNQGFTIALHGDSHFLFSEISHQKRVDQIKLSQTHLKENYSIESNDFAFPFTDFGLSKFSIEKLREECNLRYTFGTAGIKEDDIHNHYQRIPMENGKASAQVIITGELIYSILLKWINRNQVKRRN